MSKKAVKPFLRADREIWSCLPHTVERQPRKKKGTDEDSAYQFSYTRIIPRSQQCSLCFLRMNARYLGLHYSTISNFLTEKT